MSPASPTAAFPTLETKRLSKKRWGQNQKVMELIRALKIDKFEFYEQNKSLLRF